MTEDLKRGLRPKRPPKYRASDEQDPENPSFTRPNYAKITITSHTHEYISPSVILNQNAKLLVKFINKSNKSTFFPKGDLRQVRLIREESQREQAKKENIAKEKMSIQNLQTHKKQPTNSKNQKPEPPKKNKQLYNFKGLHQNGDLLKNITQQQGLKGVKGIESLSGLINNINNKGIYSGPLSNQLSQLQSLYPNLKEFNYQTLTQSPNPNLFQFGQSNAPQQNSHSPTGQVQSQGQTQPSQKSVSQKPKGALKPGKIQQKRQEVGTEKIFKRSSFHVAIAYHIYLKNLCDQGIDSGNLIDPTYKARVVKEQARLTNDQQ